MCVRDNTVCVLYSSVKLQCESPPYPPQPTTPPATSVPDSERPICFSDVTEALSSLLLWESEDTDGGRDLSKDRASKML